MKLKSFLTSLLAQPLNWLLLAVPVAMALHLLHAPAIWVFGVSCLGIIPLAGLMGTATENLAHTMGAGIGGLLNATFGNAAELIIALMLLRKGPAMYPLVKASITGSIIGNILLVLGASMVAGGIRHKRQVFNRTAAGLGATLLSLATIGLIIPTIYYFIYQGSMSIGGAGALPAAQQTTVNYISEEIALVLALTYGLSLYFSLRTHSHLYLGETEEAEMARNVQSALQWSRRLSVIVLLVSTALIALASEFLVESVEQAAHRLGLNSIFVGVIVVAIIGNAAEHSTAILMAHKNKMDLALNVAVGSGIQIALFVAPVLVLASMLLGQPMDLHFTAMETAAVLISIVILALVCQDGESHWMEGVMMLAVYVMLALAFYHLPDAAQMVGELAPGH